MLNLNPDMRPSINEILKLNFIGIQKKVLQSKLLRMQNLKKRNPYKVRGYIKSARVSKRKMSVEKPKNCKSKKNSISKKKIHKNPKQKVFEIDNVVGYKTEGVVNKKDKKDTIKVFNIKKAKIVDDETQDKSHFLKPPLIQESKFIEKLSDPTKIAENEKKIQLKFIKKGIKDKSNQSRKLRAYTYRSKSNRVDNKNSKELEMDYMEMYKNRFKKHQRTKNNGLFIPKIKQ
jgi:hypothetical protein